MNCNNNRSCCSPCSALAQQLEETTDRAIQAYNLAVQGLRNPVNENLIINGDLLVNGDIFQYGAAYETHAEKVYTNDDYIVMRDGAVSGLAAGDYSGFQVTKYDGVNDGRLVIDKDGTARVGDVSDEQPLATRDESADLTDGHLVKWDATNLKLIDSGVAADNVGMEFLAKGNVNVYVVTPYEMQSVTINLPSPAEFTSDYDYMVTANVLNADDYSVMDDVTISLPNNTVTTPGTSFNIGITTGDDVVVYWYVYRMKKNHTGLPNLFGSFPASLETQPKLVSGTNIKTINNTSILGSGDITIGGSPWQMVTNTSWGVYQDIPGYTANKDLLFTYRSNSLAGELFIPKGHKIGAFRMTINGYSVSSANDYTFYQGKADATSLFVAGSQIQYECLNININNGTVTSSTNSYLTDKIIDPTSTAVGMRLFIRD